MKLEQLLKKGFASPEPYIASEGKNEGRKSILIEIDRDTRSPLTVFFRAPKEWHKQAYKTVNKGKDIELDFNWRCTRSKDKKNVYICKVGRTETTGIKQK